MPQLRSLSRIFTRSCNNMWSALRRFLMKIPRIISAARYRKLKAAFKERAIITRARLPLAAFVDWPHEIVPTYAYREVWDRCQKLEAHTANLNGELEARASIIDNLNGELEVRASIIANLKAELEARASVVQAVTAFVDWPDGFVPAYAYREVLGRCQELEAHIDNLNHELDTRASPVPAPSADPSPSELTVCSEQTADPLKHDLKVLLNVDPTREFARDFQYICPFLATRREIPIKADLMAHVGSLHIVDVGAQELENEPHVYCDLVKSWPCQVTGFDPFGETTTKANDGSRTLPYFIGTGSSSTFHINQFDATSSLLESNIVGLTPFPVLAKMLTTIETREVETCRLDDLRTGSQIAELPVDFLKIDTQGTTLDILTSGRDILKEVLICHLEAEFCQVYKGEAEFSEIDSFMKECGFSFLDFYSLGRVRYGVFHDGSHNSKFHHGRIMWCDAVYVRGLDRPEALSMRELLAQAVLLHEIYNKQDVAAYLIAEADKRDNGNLSSIYMDALKNYC
jgi:tetrahydromethanopterin S-methyltransferase subunit G